MEAPCSAGWIEILPVVTASSKAHAQEFTDCFLEFHMQADKPGRTEQESSAELKSSLK
jgi:hypothetical protein